jgi:hypothetical protein
MVGYPGNQLQSEQSKLISDLTLSDATDSCPRRQGMFDPTMQTDQYKWWELLTNGHQFKMRGVTAPQIEACPLFGWGHKAHLQCLSASAYCTHRVPSQSKKTQHSQTIRKTKIHLIDFFRTKLDIQTSSWTSEIRHYWKRILNCGDTRASILNNVWEDTGGIYNDITEKISQTQKKTSVMKMLLQFTVGWSCPMNGRDMMTQQLDVSIGYLLKWLTSNKWLLKAD